MNPQSPLTTPPLTHGHTAHEAQNVHFSPEGISHCIAQIRQPLQILRQTRTGHLGLMLGPQPERQTLAEAALEAIGTLPPLYPEWLGDRSFLETHGVRFAYVTGSMANGIATTDLVAAMAEAHMLGFFGAAGLGFERVVQALDTLEARLNGRSLAWGINLIHSPQDPALEDRLADLYIQRGVSRVSASAFMRLTPSIVRYACSGLSVTPQSQIQRRHHVFAKVSRPEVAAQFMNPAPPEMLRALVGQGLLTPEEANLAAQVPLAEDITIESDSGGHTDNRPLLALFPTIAATRDAIMAQHRFARPIRLGAAGGLGTPLAIASAFSLGAAYVMTGSINQAAVEAGLSQSGKEMLATADIADVMMAPAADMFEMGINVQVLKRSTLFGPRARKLYEIFRAYPSLEAIPPHIQAELETRVLGERLETIWAETQRFWLSRGPQEIKRAEADPKHKMALCFRWYLGLASRWAIGGEPSRKMDYQIWCGPAMGAFNTWVKDSFLADLANRSVVQMALNLLEGGASITRALQCRTYGLPVPAAAFQFVPQRLA